ncbi:FdtA/QdtA family cupin domain-containing protein [Myroides sp. WP-1]|uniref:sugar 3,4-ketoisomerase n=1 Tax=Myroides sp. WP-1 TaxID=2759944 RepID=UPI0015F81130|nr:FdtA/QdtA family cupin domain-containing protein [Myroides sp. WP-1]MBB1139047.1 WxcM-like domain-containing protein [Myroides sp. WP-1]
MKKYTIFDCSEINIPEIIDERGNLAVIQEDTVPFAIKRLFFIYDVPHGKNRGGHAHKEQSTVLFALHGSLDVILDDGIHSRKVHLHEPTTGLLLQPGIWSKLENFDAGTVCLAVNSDVYDEGDYIRSYELFLALVASTQEV